MGGEEQKMENVKSFATVLQQNQLDTKKSSNIQILKIIPPFSRDHVKSIDRLNEAYGQCAERILAVLPDQIQDKTAISRTFTTTTNGKKLHSLTIIAPPESEPYITAMKTEGIGLMGKTIYPVGFIPKHQRSGEFYPRKVKIKLCHLPFICNDSETKALLKLPQGIEHSPVLQRETFELENGRSVHTGRATLEVILKNEQQRAELTDWSYNNAMGEGAFWNDLNITFHAPSLHMCEHCESEGRLSKGHHKDWCNLIKKVVAQTQYMPATEDISEQVAVTNEKQETNPPLIIDSDDSHPNLLIDEAPATQTCESEETLAEDFVERTETNCPMPKSVPYKDTPKPNSQISKATFFTLPNDREMSPFNFVRLQRRSRPNSRMRRKFKERAQIRKPDDRDQPVEDY